MTSLPATFTAAALLALAPMGAAWAQAPNNTISILQEGERNTLTVDQSNATDSAVGGLTVDGLESATGLAIDPAGNQIFALDPETGEPTTQAVVGSAQFRSVRFDPQNPGVALQQGANNAANVTIEGNGGTVGLLQQNERGQIGNSAAVNLIGDSTALIGQLGAGNFAGLDVSGSGAQGLVVQEGSGNEANLIVNGDGRSGSITQLGNGNANSLNVTSLGGPTNVDLIVQGNGLGNPDTGVSVVTNAQSVTITQTSLVP